jgi:hypothetical protein
MKKCDTARGKQKRNFTTEPWNQAIGEECPLRKLSPEQDPEQKKLIIFI